MALASIILCYLLWGLFPIFWKQLSHISPIEILFHRILWSFFFYGLSMIAISLISKNGKSTVLSGNYSGNLWLKLFVSSAMITSNWLLYIYAVNSGQILQGSLAYYLSPLISVLAGTLVFKEALNSRIRWALCFCGFGVLLLAIGGSLVSGHLPSIPWLALSLALTFSGYSLIKKTVRVPAITSSFIEGIFFIFPAIYFIFFSNISTISFYTAKDWVYFIAGGIVTGLPLVFFSYGAQRLPFATLGFFQYISPTLQLLTAVFIYAEEFNSTKIAAFSFIWIGVGIYIYNLVESPPHSSSDVQIVRDPGP